MGTISKTQVESTHKLYALVPSREKTKQAPSGFQLCQHCATFAVLRQYMHLFIFS